MQYFLMTLLLLTGSFLILLVLVQRGRGGGLAGAFGGMGGQSAFGTKAGDMFTRITIGVAAFWIILCAVSVKLLSTPTSKIDQTLGGASTSTETPGPTPGKDAAVPATTDKSDDKSSTDSKATTTETPPAAATTPATPLPAEAPPAEKTDSAK